jgi:hypothetical protein
MTDNNDALKAPDAGVDVEIHALEQTEHGLIASFIVPEGFPKTVPQKITIHGVLLVSAKKQGE